MTTLRPYQQEAASKTMDALTFEKKKAVVIVSPTGSGKTVIGEALTNSRTAWVVHRIELLEQTKRRLRTDRVYTIQSMLNMEKLPDCDRLIIDECHHAVSDQWGKVFQSYKANSIPIVGLTATPQRADGTPLGDLFDHMVVAANYSDLIDLGHIVKCEVIRPEEELQGREIADSLKAYKEFGEGRTGFVFCPTITDANQLCQKFNEALIPSACITSQTDPEERSRILERFKDGCYALLFNVYIMTEGIDVPHASICVLARGCGHQSTYLQMVGRVLRPHPTKKQALLLDLSGVSNRLGHPTDDRKYSLDGKGISRIDGPTIELDGDDSTEVKRISYNTYMVEGTLVELYNVELIRGGYAGKKTDQTLKDKEWFRLLGLCNCNGWPISWAIKKYKGTFKELPEDAPKYKQEIWDQLLKEQAEKGYKKGWAYYRYSDIFK